MKSGLLSLLCLFLVACGNPESGFLIERNTSVVEERPLISSTEVAQEELKDAARSMLLGKSSDDKVISKFSALLSIGNGEENKFKDKIAYSNYLTKVELETANLNSELMSIFNERIEVYLNLLNASLSQKNISSVKIKFDENNPRSAQAALNSLYSSLRSRAKDLSLREQYMVFQLTEFFIQKYNSENIEEIVPRDSVAKFVETLILLGKNSPQETFRKYQVLNKILSDGQLLSVFKPILAKVIIDKSSNYNEIELFRKMAYFSVAQKYTEFAENSDDVKKYFKSLYFSSSLLVKNIPGKDSEAQNFFKSINMTFQSNQIYLGKMAAENGMSLDDVAEIQDLFVKEYYFSFLKSLDEKSARYKQFLESNHVSNSSLHLEIILAAFQNEEKRIDFASLLVKYDESLKGFKIIQDESMQAYMSDYHIATVGNLLLAINGKYNSETTKNHKKMYELNEKSKEALKFVLNQRNINQIVLLNEAINEKDEDDSVYLMSGVFKGNLKTSKNLYLHPLAVLIPEHDQLIIEAQSLSGGRIDGSFQKIDSTEVINQNEAVAVSRGSNPSQNALVSKDNANKCKDKVSVCREMGVAGGSIKYERSVSAGTTPEKEKSGSRGLNGKNIQIKLSKLTVLDSLVVSNGLRGFKGRKGLNSPLCNSANEYQPFMGLSYSFSCTYEGVPKECNNVLASYESSRSAFNVDAGVSGDGGIGGFGGDILITIADANVLNYPAISLGGLGGIPGDGASCRDVRQSSALIGNEGRVGENGKISLQK